MSFDAQILEDIFFGRKDVISENEYNVSASKHRRSNITFPDKLCHTVNPISNNVIQLGRDVPLVDQGLLFCKPVEEH